MVVCLTCISGYLNQVQVVFFHYRGGHHERHRHQLNKMFKFCSGTKLCVDLRALYIVHKAHFFKSSQLVSLCVSIFSGSVNSY